MISLSASRLPVRNRLTCPTWQEACIWQRWSEGLFPLVAMHASRFRNCVGAERNRVGGARNKWGSQRPRATLRLEIHAAQEALEARAGARGLFQICVLRLGFLQDGDIGVGVSPKAQEVLISGAALILVVRKRVGARQSQLGQWQQR